MPPLFCIYLLALVVLEILPLESRLASLKIFVAAPLAVYFAAIVLQTLALVPAGGVVRSFLAMPLLVASHLFYGFGFWRGLFTSLNPGQNKLPVEVVLENIRP